MAYSISKFASIEKRRRKEEAADEGWRGGRI
jgi:hypothetical protein